MKSNPNRSGRPRLRAERVARGWTQQFVASRIKVTIRAYQNYEYGERNPSLSAANRLEDLFEVPQRELLVRIDSTSNSDKTEVSQNTA